MIQRAELAREHARRHGFLGFARAFWHLAEPSAAFVESWHHGAMCEFATAFSMFQFKIGVVNVPPSHTKSLLFQVLWPAWVWSQRPAEAVMSVSYDLNLVVKHAERTYDVVSSPLFQQAFPGKVTIKGSKPSFRDYSNTAGGRRFSTSIDGKSTGTHADYQVLDDPVKAKDFTVVELDKAWSRISRTFSTRHRNAERFSRLLVMQRLHAMDPAQRFLQQPGTEHLCLPFEYVPQCSWDLGNSLGIADQRTEPGEVLWEARFPTPESRALARANLGGEADAQLQQNPTPGTGGYVEESWLELVWQDLPLDCIFFQSWDFGHKGEKASHSNSVGQLWAATSSLVKAYRLTNSRTDREKGHAPEFEEVRLAPATRFLLVDEVAGIWNYPKSRIEFRAAQDRPYWDRADVKIIEDKANGVAIRQDFDAEVPGLMAVEAEGSKELRFKVQTTKFAGKLVVYPDATFADVNRAELVGFPNFGKDDRVDTTSQFLRLAGELTGYNADLAAAAKALIE